MKQKPHLNTPAKIVVAIITIVLTVFIFTSLFDKTATEKLIYPIYAYTDQWQRDHIKDKDELLSFEMYILNRELTNLKYFERRGFDTTEIQQKIQIQINKLQPEMDYIYNNEHLSKDLNEMIAKYNTDTMLPRNQIYVEILQSINNLQNSPVESGNNNGVQNANEQNVQNQNSSAKEINDNNQEHSNAPATNPQPQPGKPKTLPQANPGGNGKKKDK